jgi:hypothetical protein
MPPSIILLRTTDDVHRFYLLARLLFYLNIPTNRLFFSFIGLGFYYRIFFGCNLQYPPKSLFATNYLIVN